jgi:hypothetical protein
MENDILKQTVKTVSTSPARHKISALGVFLTIILAVILVVLGERVIFDLNKSFNPYVEKVNSGMGSSGYNSASYGPLLSENNALSRDIVYYKSSQSDQYFASKVLIQSSFIIPIFILFFLLYYFVNIKNKESNLRVVSYAYLVFAIWMIIHLVINLIRLAYRQFPQAALYIVLLLLAVVFTSLAVFIQKKVNQHNQ